ncbi:MAG: hypothetical protein V1835_00250 [Candidatus Micrarchaeota archaeon]
MAYAFSAPGKILWLGGYSVLEKGNVSLVTVVDKRVYAKCGECRGQSVIFEIPQLKTKINAEIKSGKFASDSSADSLKKAKFVSAAAKNCVKYLAAKGKHIAGFKLTTVSDSSFGTGRMKTGLGSSAAVTVAAVAAILGMHGINVEGEKGKIILHNLSQLSHSEAQGKVGSGFDIAAAVYGNIEYSRYSPEIIAKAQKKKGAEFAKLIEKNWGYTIEPVSLPKYFIPVLAFTNVSASTSEMVKKVMELKKKEKRTYSEMIHEINDANVEAIGSLSQIPANKIIALQQFKTHFDDARLLTKKLGELAGAQIESSNLTKLIQVSLSKGAHVCRLPGAGGGDSVAAICLNENDAARLNKLWKSLKLKILDAKFGAEGVRKETSAKFELALKTNT